jgi:perosamine synthetase
MLRIGARHVISQMEPWFGDEEKNAVAAYLGSGGWLTEFRETAKFAEMIREYVGSSFCSVLSNGTVSLIAALLALDVKAGDEVLVPDYTMIATANAVQILGAKPVFVDVDPKMLCIDLDEAEKALTPRTRAMMLVSLNGRAPDMNRAVSFSRNARIHLVEDAAQSLGSRFCGRHLGTFGIVGSFSFSAPKIITTGQGGALVTDDEEVAQKIHLIRDFGRPKPGVDFHQIIGFNFKFTDLQAVVGIEQMKKLEWRVRRKKEIFALYRESLTNVPSVTFLPTNLDDVTPWFADIMVPDPDSLIRHLQQAGIGARRFYPAIHSQPAYNCPGSFPVSEYASAHGLWLPSSSFLTDEQIREICERIRECFLA